MIREADTAVELVAYIDSLLGRKVDFETLDCVRFVKGWLPDAPCPPVCYGPDTWLRYVSDYGGLHWHLRTSDYLPLRQDEWAKVGDVVWRRNEQDIPMLGIARDRVMGYFLGEDVDPGDSPVTVMPFEKTPVWVGRIP